MKKNEYFQKLKDIYFYDDRSNSQINETFHTSNDNFNTTNKLSKNKRFIIKNKSTKNTNKSRNGNLNTLTLKSFNNETQKIKNQLSSEDLIKYIQKELGNSIDSDKHVKNIVIILKDLETSLLKNIDKTFITNNNIINSKNEMKSVFQIYYNKIIRYILKYFTSSNEKFNDCLSKLKLFLNNDDNIAINKDNTSMNNLVNNLNDNTNKYNKNINVLILNTDNLIDMSNNKLIEMKNKLDELNNLIHNKHLQHSQLKKNSDIFMNDINNDIENLCSINFNIIDDIKNLNNKQNKFYKESKIIFDKIFMNEKIQKLNFQTNSQFNTIANNFPTWIRNKIVKNKKKENSLSSLININKGIQINENNNSNVIVNSIKNENKFNNSMNNINFLKINQKLNQGLIHNNSSDKNKNQFYQRRIIQNLYDKKINYTSNIDDILNNISKNESSNFSDIISTNEKNNNSNIYYLAVKILQFFEQMDELQQNIIKKTNNVNEMKVNFEKCKKKLIKISKNIIINNKIQIDKMFNTAYLNKNLSIVNTEKINIICFSKKEIEKENVLLKINNNDLKKKINTLIDENIKQTKEMAQNSEQIKNLTKDNNNQNNIIAKYKNLIKNINKEIQNKNILDVNELNEDESIEKFESNIKLILEKYKTKLEETNNKLDKSIRNLNQFSFDENDIISNINIEEDNLNLSFKNENGIKIINQEINDKEKDKININNKNNNQKVIDKLLNKKEDDSISKELLIIQKGLIEKIKLLGENEEKYKQIIHNYFLETGNDLYDTNEESISLVKYNRLLKLFQNEQTYNKDLENKYFLFVNNVTTKLAKYLDIIQLEEKSIQINLTQNN